MSSRDTYQPGPAAGARIEKHDEAWTLVVVRDLRHPPEKVWAALTDPAQLSQWAPFDADRNLASKGPMKLSTYGAPQPHVTECEVKKAEAPKFLEYTWGGFELRWELEPHQGGTRLTLWNNIDRNYIAWGAAGWQICLDVMDHLLAGDPLGRMAGPETMKFSGWGRLVGEYQKLFNVPPPSWQK